MGKNNKKHLKVIEQARTAEVIAEEYLEWKNLAKETADKAKELRNELLGFTHGMHDELLREGKVEKLAVGPANVNYISRFKALGAADVMLLEAQLGELASDVIDQKETIGLKAGLTMEVLEAVLGTKMERLRPLLDITTSAKLSKATWPTIAKLFDAGQDEEAEALLEKARETAYEPHVKS